MTVRMFRGLKLMTYKERPRELSSYKLKVRGDLTADYKYTT